MSEEHIKPELEAANVLLELINIDRIDKPIKFSDFSCQINTPKKLTNLKFIKSETALASLTGLNSFK